MIGLLYLLDANVLIDADRDYYPIQRVPGFWNWLVYLGEQEQVRVPWEVYVKVTDANDDLASWLKDHRDTLLLSENVIPDLVNYVISEGYADDLTDDEIEKLNEDPFLIAYALADSERRRVVTTERSRPSRERANRHIPDVCDGLGVCHRNTVQLIDELDFRTDWIARNT